MNRINKTCAEIQTDGGFEYRLQSNILNQTNTPDCDQSWYSQVCVSVLKLHHYTHTWSDQSWYSEVCVCFCPLSILLCLVCSGRASDSRSIRSWNTDGCC